MGSGVFRSDAAIYRFVVQPRLKSDCNQSPRADEPLDPRSAAYLSDAHALGLEGVEQIQCHDLFFIEGRLSEGDLERLAVRLLSDPLTQSVTWTALNHHHEETQGDTRTGQHQIEVALRPGVTDPVAEQIVRAAQVLGITGVHRASTGQRFLIKGQHLDEQVLHLLAKRLLANPVIQWYALGTIEPVFPEEAEASGRVETFDVRAMTDAELMRLSQERQAALDLAEMQAIRRYFQHEKRLMADIEFETIAQTWSEHCGHKTFKAHIQIKNPRSPHETEIDNLLKTYLRAATDAIGAPWVLSAFVDNAGILAFDEEYEVSFKVETHNHPSAIEPFGGANTGVGGVIRDVIGVSAKPIAATDVLCFGPQDQSLEDLPEGVLHPRRIRSGVVAGVRDYGNKIGLSTVSGAILYDPGFTTNPLVFCGCVGIAPRGKHVCQPQPGDRVIVLGGRTGRDGLRGATFSSMTMDAQTGEVAGASVQIGAPITEKGLIDVIVQARDEGLYHAVTDCGAGGLSSAVGEMASTVGADVDLKDVRLKYPGLAPWEIWLSEAQERMVLAVKETDLSRLQALCDRYDVEWTDIGQFEASSRLVVRYGQQRLLDLSNAFLHDGIPQRQLIAVLPTSEQRREEANVPEAVRLNINETLAGLLLKLLAHPNIASKEDVIRTYDHEVQGGTVVKPLTGAQNDGPSDAVALRPMGTRSRQAVVLSNGINPEYGKRNPYRMAFCVIDEAVRNAVAVGADPTRIALLDNFCWGNPLNPKTMGELVECTRGCHDAALLYRTPFISGKDSLNNEYLGKDGLRHAIPPTLLISAIGFTEDIDQVVTMDLKEVGNPVYLLGRFQPKLAGSHFALIMADGLTNTASDIPEPDFEAPKLYQQLHYAMQSGLVRSCHDLSEGGLAVSAAEMCIGGRLGLTLELSNQEEALSTLFGETNGCLLVEVPADQSAAFEARLAGLPARKLGTVTGEAQLVVQQDNQERLSMPVRQLVAAWQNKGA